MVVFLAFNEEANIGTLIDQTMQILPEFTDKWEIIVVDDGSADRTSEIVKEYADKNVYVIRHPSNRGYGAALKSGIIYANSIYY